MENHDTVVFTDSDENTLTFETFKNCCESFGYFMSQKIDFSKPENFNVLEKFNKEILKEFSFTGNYKEYESLEGYYKPSVVEFELKSSKIPLYLYLYLPSRTGLVFKREPVRKATDI